MPVISGALIVAAASWECGGLPPLWIASATRNLPDEVVRLLRPLLIWQAPPVQEQFRDFIENAETFVLEVIFEQRRGKLANFVRACLFGASKLFGALVKPYQ